MYLDRLMFDQTSHRSYIDIKVKELTSIVEKVQGLI
jgi:hypothetical protein